MENCEGREQKHLAFAKTVNLSKMVRNKAQTLLEEIRGENNPKAEAADVKEERVSLMKTLDVAPGKIQDCLDEINNTLSAIKEALF